MKLQALDKYVIICPVRAAKETAGGILLPQTHESPYEDGATVISIGPNVQGLAVGDIVVRPDPPRFEIVDDATKEEFWLCAEEDILAKFMPDDVPQRYTHPPLGTIPLSPDSEVEDGDS